MAANTRIFCLGLLAILLFVVVVRAESSTPEAIVRLPVMQPEHKADDASKSNGNDLLSTLQELHHSLIAQIAVLEKKLRTPLTADEMSETTHLVQHYTAQKNNIDWEISLIQAMDGSHTSNTAPRHILKSLSPEEKIVPSLLSIFKKNRNPSNDQFNDDIPYSLPYQPQYVPSYGPQYPTYPYHHPPPHPPHPNPYPNDLIQNTFSGYEPQYNNHHHHHNYPHNPTTFARDQPFQSYRHSVVPTSQPTIEIPSQYTPTPRVTLQADVEPPQLPADQQKVQSQPPPAPQINGSYTPQRLQLEEEPDVDILKKQDQGQYGQKQGVFIYYPNGIVTDDDSERPTIGDRFGQAIDRFGQAISNLANRQVSRNANVRIDSSSKRIRVNKSRPRSSSNEKVRETDYKTVDNEKLQARELDNKNESNEQLTSRELFNKRPTNERWTARQLGNKKPSSEQLTPQLLENKKPKLRWVSV